MWNNKDFYTFITKRDLLWWTPVLLKHQAFVESTPAGSDVYSVTEFVEKFVDRGFHQHELIAMAHSMVHTNIMLALSRLLGKPFLFSTFLVFEDPKLKTVVVADGKLHSILLQDNSSFADVMSIILAVLSVDENFFEDMMMHWRIHSVKLYQEFLGKKKEVTEPNNQMKRRRKKSLEDVPAKKKI